MSWIDDYGKGKSWVAQRMGVQNSLTVSARTGARELVAAVRWLTQNGYEPTTRSEIVGLCVKMVASQVGEEDWVSTEEAHNFLDQHFGVLTKRAGKMVRSARIKDPQVREEAYRMMQGMDGNLGQAQVGGATTPPPEMRQKDGVMYIIHATNEGLREDMEKYRAQIAAGTVKVVSREEWAEIDRAPTLGLDALMENNAL